MNAAELLSELDAAGIHVAFAGENLRVRANPGVSVATYMARIKSLKPALLRELLQQRIVEAATVEPDQFDRAAYDRLWVLWHAQDAKEESTP